MGLIYVSTTFKVFPPFEPKGISKYNFQGSALVEIKSALRPVADMQLHETSKQEKTHIRI